MAPGAWPRRIPTSGPPWCRSAGRAIPPTPAVKVEGSRDMIKALKDAGASPKYTEYPGVGHNSWDMAYGTSDLYDWLLMQKLK